MLKKLFKYEWKAIWKIPAFINLFLVVITLAGVISLLSPLWNQDYSDIINALLVLAILFYFLAIFAGSIAVAVYTAIRFYKNTYTDEGYLTHTLPVTPRDIILSKLFVGSIWNIITAIVIVFSIIVLTFTALINFGDFNIFAEWGEILPYLQDIITQEFGMTVWGFNLYLILYFILSTIFSIIMMYAAISLGQLFTKHKVMGSFLWYIAFYTVMQIGSSLMANIPLSLNNFNLDFDAGAYFKPVMAISFVMTIVISIALFYLTEYMMRKKLNLD